MKKLINFLLALSLAITSIGFIYKADVKANDQNGHYHNVTSFGLKNYSEVVEINSTDKIPVNLETESDLFDAEGIFKYKEYFYAYFVTNTNDIVVGYIEKGYIRFNEDYKYRYETLEFLALVSSMSYVYDDTDGEYHFTDDKYYSSKPFEKLKEYASENCRLDEEGENCNTFNYIKKENYNSLKIKDFTIKFKDYSLDDSISNISNIKIE